MCRINELLQLLQQNTIVSLAGIQTALRISRRSAFEVLRDSRKIGAKNGFSIRTISGEGYQLVVNDKTLLDGLLQSGNKQNGDLVAHRGYRLNIILYYLLQENNFISLQKLADLLDVNRNTLLLDLPFLRQKLGQNNLQLLSKPYYGIKITGEELWLRRAFHLFVLESEAYQGGAREYVAFLKDFPLEGLYAEIEQILQGAGIYAESAALHSILTHIKILIYRVRKGNYVNDFQTQVDLDAKYLQAAKAITKILAKRCQLVIPELESKYLAMQIAGRTCLAEIPEQERVLEQKRIHAILEKLDRYFSTNFAQDKQLEEGLELHMYPLLKRIAFQMELDNPLIDLVSMRYANVFLIALRFSELWQGLPISQDEVGYLALHFATHLEREQNKIFNNVRRILGVGNFRGGNRYLLQTKLEQIFPDAKISFVHSWLEAKDQAGQADLVLVTEENKGLPVRKVVLSEFLTEEDLDKIKAEVLFRAEDINQTELELPVLFRPELFSVQERPEDYLEFLKLQAQKMVEAGWADPSYPLSVVEREQRFSTIYKNEVAGPHGMELNARENTIGFYRFTKPLDWKGQKVRVVFLLNLKRGQLFLYREISDLLLSFMEDEAKRRRLLKVENFQELVYLLNDMK